MLYNGRYMKTIIYTDLDGTFINHHDYSFDEALPSVALIKEKQIPLIFTTSKTRVEVERLQQKVGIIEPFIIENGAAIFFPAEKYQTLELDEIDTYKTIVLGRPYIEILNFYNQYKKKYGMNGFSDMAISEIAEHTGLDEKIARYAKQREFSEPFLLQQEEKIDELVELARHDGLKITRGGRFYHLIGVNQDKGLAVQQANQIFRQEYKQIRTIGLGDSPNDIALLEQVDVAIAIQKHDGSYLDWPAKKSSYVGARGWNEKVLEELK